MSGPVAQVRECGVNRRLPAWRCRSVGLLGLTLAARAAAHDFWIEPADSAPEPGQPVAVHLRVGEHFSGAAVARPDASSMHRFVLVDTTSNASATLPGRTGADPAGVFRPPGPGAYVIGFHGKPNAIELPPEKFNAYLREEGLDAVLALRAERDQLGQPGREIYSRCAKSLVLTRAACAACQPADRKLGFALELIAERQPWVLREGELLPVRLLYEGQPLAGALVVALRRTDPASKTMLRSDADGRVLLAVPHGGQWLVKAVHMRPAPPESGADWESLWASLSFAIDSGR
jgi:uncharacterized GH25 family protein